MNFEILDVHHKAAFDHSIVYGEKRTHLPYASTSFNNNDEIRIPIEHQDVYTLPWYSALYVEGKVTVFDNDNKLIPFSEVPAAKTSFINNGILLLFDEIRYEISGTIVDRVRNPGLSSTLKGYATYNKNQCTALQNAGWYPTGESKILDRKTGQFNVSIPLKMFLGLCEDFKKVILNVRQELVLIRSNTDINALISDDASTKIKVDLNKIYWKMPHVAVADAERLKLMSILGSGKELEIPFRSRELHEYPLLPQTQRHTWPIKTTIEKPQYIFFALQTDRKNQLNKDFSKFDHCDLSNIKVYLNDEMYPYDNLNNNFSSNQFAILYDMFIGFQESFLDKESEPLFTPEEFKTYAPIVIIDCSKQNETLKQSAVSIRIEFETRINVPDKTSAYCLILHDRIAKYVPAQSVVRLT